MNNFELLVKQMREAQRSLLRKSTPEKITKVNKLEHSVDKWLEVKQTAPKESVIPNNS